MNTITTDLNIEIRSADGTLTEFYQTDEQCIQEALRVLSSPRLFAEPHLLLTSRHCASMMPCKGIDMVLARTSGPMPLKFPLNLPVGHFDLVELPEDPHDSHETESPHGRELGQEHRRNARVEVRTVGGWSVSLKTVAVIRGHLQDERQFFAHLPEMPTIPFRLQEGGMGFINTANITRASAWPKPEALPGTPLPLILRKRTQSVRSAYELKWVQ